MRGRNLQGTFPDLTGLSNLRALDLSFNPITGPIHASVYTLSTLIYLWLGNMQLSGGISEDVGNLKNLEVLNVDSNGLKGPLPKNIGTLTSMSNFVWFDLSHNQLNGSIPTSLGKLTKVKNLWLSDNKLTGTLPASLSALTQVEIFEVYQNQLYGDIPASFSLLTKLTQILLDKNYFQGTVPEFVYKTSIHAYDNNCFSADLIKDPTPGKNSVQRLQSECDTFYKSLNSDPKSGTPASTGSSGSSALSGAAIGGIVAVAVVVLIAAIVGVKYLKRRRNPSPDTMKFIASSEAPFSISNVSVSTPPNVYGQEPLPPPSVVSFSSPIQEPGSPVVPADDKTTSHSRSPSPSTDARYSEQNYGPLVKIDDPVPPQRGISAAVKPFPASTIRKFAYDPSGVDATGSSAPSSSLLEAAKWTPEQVADWLEAMDVSPRLSALLKENGVTGYQLLVLTNEKLMEIGVVQEVSREFVLNVVDKLRGGRAQVSGVVQNPAPPQYS
ncbi:hypothetical protein HDU97_002147 [Phlyctochytrium planicorne]|nr:hypothetical protein HDU97_002147 [Phlyctochytrium planicorne]